MLIKYIIPCTVFSKQILFDILHLCYLKNPKLSKSEFSLKINSIHLKLNKINKQK